MFKIRGNDSQEYGPVSAEVVRQWIAERRANAQTLVKAEGSAEFKPLSQFPEFQQALAQSAASSLPAPSAIAATASPASASGPASSGLAISSLVLGIASFCLLPFLAAIPAIITGHIALNRIRREPAAYAGKGQATAGLVLGYLNFAFIPLIAIMAGLLLPALSKAKGKAHRISCVSNMKMIGLAARMYANDNKDVFPLNFLSMSNELSTPKILICPSDSAHVRVLDWSQFSESANLSYEYLLPGTKAEETPTQTVFLCPIHNNAGLADGSVMQLPTRR